MDLALEMVGIDGEFWEETILIVYKLWTLLTEIKRADEIVLSFPANENEFFILGYDIIKMSTEMFLSKSKNRKFDENGGKKLEKKLKV